jgi:hypothetical protein
MSKNEYLFLESKVRFLQEKIESLEKDTGPLYYLMPVRVYDLRLIDDISNPSNISFFLFAVIHRPGDVKANVIKIPRKTLEELARTDKEITIDNYVLTDHIATRRFVNRKWVWKLIA